MDSFVNVRISRVVDSGLWPCSYRILLAVTISIIVAEDRVERQGPSRCSLAIEEHASDKGIGERARVWINGMLVFVHGLILRLSLHYASSTCLGVTSFSYTEKREKPTNVS
jgi:hypothetical protein